MEIEAPEDLLKWFPKKEIETLEELLARPLNNEVMFLQNHLAELAVQQGVLSRFLADAESLLAFTEQKALSMRNDGWTDLDRKVNLKASTRNERRIRDILEGFSKALRSKMIAVMGLKKTLSGELPRGDF